MATFMGFDELMTFNVFNAVLMVVHAWIGWHIEADTQWPSFCRQDFQIDFHVWKMYFDSNFIEMYSQKSGYQ